MPLEVADAPADLIQPDGNLGEGWYQVCCQVDLYRFVNKDSFLLLDLLGWCKDDLAIFLQPCNTWRDSATSALWSKRPPILPIFRQTLSVFSNPLDLLDHSLLLDIFFLGTPQLRTGFRFLFFFKVSFMKHPSVHV